MNLALEQHYTPAELAHRWGFTAKFVRKMFENEANVLVINRPETVRKRKYRTIRIPASVATRVHDAYCARKGAKR